MFAKADCVWRKGGLMKKTLGFLLSSLMVVLVTATWVKADEVRTVTAEGVGAILAGDVALARDRAIKDAQRVRLGYQSWRQSIRSLGILGGSLILRAYDRAERVCEAMEARGYTGVMTASYTEAFGRKDFIAAICLSALLMIFYLVGQMRA